MQLSRVYLKQHKRLFKIPPTTANQSNHWEEMWPAELATYHPVQEVLLKYTWEGWPIKTGKPCTRQEMEAAIEKDLMWLC